MPGHSPAFIYVLPNYQNPTGVTMTLERRKRIVELAEEFDTLIIEDDAYFDLRYDGEAHSDDLLARSQRRTLYLGTLSKTLAAGFRIGWVVAPGAAHSPPRGAEDRWRHQYSSAPIVAASWLPEHFERHVAELREIYRRGAT